MAFSLPDAPPGASAARRPKADAAVRVPVVVVSGYLGSGKTTLIASLLSRPVMAGTAVIVNELAAAGIDQSIIADAGAEDVVLLSNGCICCAAGSDLRNAVARVLALRAGRAAPARILIETSGAADPGPVLRQVCFDPVLRNRVRYGGVIVTFDAENGLAMLDRDPVGLRQIGLADRLLMTKADIADAGQIAAARALLSSLNPNAPIIQSGDDAARFIAASGRGISAAAMTAWLGAEGADAPPAHDRRLSTWSVFGTGRTDWSRAEPILRRSFDRLGDAVIRTKGIVWTAGDDRPLVIHGIGRHFNRPVRLSAWDGEPRSRFVVIGLPEAAAVAEAAAEAIGGRVAAGDGTGSLHNDDAASRQRASG